MAKQFFTDIQTTGVIQFKNNLSDSQHVNIKTDSFNILKTNEIEGADRALSNSVIATLGTDSHQSLVISAWTGMNTSDKSVKIKAKTTNSEFESEWVTIYDTSSTEVFYIPSSANMTVDFSHGSTVFDINLTDKNTNVIINPISNQQVASCTLILTQVTGANLVTWSPNVKWSFGRPVVLSYEQNAKDIISLETFDAGVTWYGALIRAGV